MVSDDDRLWATRRELAAVTRKLGTAAERAMQLLKPKAERAPGSAEALAYAELAAAVQYVLSWAAGAKLILPAEGMKPDAPPANENPPEGS
jgi:hypothetical protein